MKNCFFRFFLLLILSIFITQAYFQNSDAQWIQKSNGIGTNKNIYAFASNGNYLFAGTDSNGIFRSSNNGENWTAVNNGITSLNILCFKTAGNYIFAGTISGGVFRSSNYGDVWIPVNSGLTDNKILTLEFNGTNLYAGVGGFTNGNVFQSTNYGSNWSTIGTFNQGISLIYANGIYLYAIASIGMSGQYFISTNNGVNWSSPYNINYNIIDLFIANGSYLFAGTAHGIYKSTNNGINWVSGGLNNIDIYDFALSGSNLFAATWDDTITRGCVYLSTNNGTNWIKKNQGMNVMIVHALHIFNNYIYAGTYKSSVLRRSFSEIIGIEQISKEIPLNYSLKQNYPNPFNPSTNIRYQISKNSFVTLKVYNSLGNEIETLVKNKQSPGTYEIAFDASKYPSGIYFYRLNADNFSETRKMVLVK